MKKLDFLYLSGVINENQYHEEMDMEDDDGVMELPQFKRMMSKLSVRMGDKANNYLPLLKYIAKKEDLLAMFESLVEELMGLQTATGKSILKPFMNNKI